MQQVKYSNALGIDYGSKRIGLARVNAVAKLPEPLGTYDNNEHFSELLTKLLKDYEIDLIVIGLPRNLKGQETPQTARVKDFANQVLRNITAVPCIFQDETLSSASAESLNSPDAVRKFGLDSFAAVEILKDFVRSQGL